MKYTFSNRWLWICLPSFSYQFALSRVTWSTAQTYLRYWLMSALWGSATRCNAQRHSLRSLLIEYSSSTGVLEGTFDDFEMEKIQCFHLFRLKAVRKHTVFCNLFHLDVWICSLELQRYLRERLEGRRFWVLCRSNSNICSVGNLGRLFSKMKVDSRFNMHENHFFGSVPIQYASWVKHMLN